MCDEVVGGGIVARGSMVSSYVVRKSEVLFEGRSWRLESDLGMYCSFLGPGGRMRVMPSWFEDGWT